MPSLSPLFSPYLRDPDGKAMLFLFLMKKKELRRLLEEDRRRQRREREKSISAVRRRRRKKKSWSRREVSVLCEVATDRQKEGERRGKDDTAEKETNEGSWAGTQKKKTALRRKKV